MPHCRNTQSEGHVLHAQEGRVLASTQCVPLSLFRSPYLSTESSCDPPADTRLPWSCDPNAHTCTPGSGVGPSCRPFFHLSTPSLSSSPRAVWLLWVASWVGTGTRSGAASSSPSGTVGVCDTGHRVRQRKNPGVSRRPREVLRGLGRVGTRVPRGAGPPPGRHSGSGSRLRRGAWRTERAGRRAGICVSPGEGCPGRTAASLRCIRTRPRQPLRVFWGCSRRAPCLP